MKKFLSAILFLAAMTATVFCLTACGGDDDNEGGESSSALVGTWECVSSRFYSDDGWEEYEEEDGYWVFTRDKVTIYDEDDLADGKTFGYTFDGNQLIISGYPLWTVKSFSNTTMVLKARIIDGYQEATFKKR